MLNKRSLRGSISSLGIFANFTPVAITDVSGVVPIPISSPHGLCGETTPHMVKYEQCYLRDKHVLKYPF